MKLRRTMKAEIPKRMKRKEIIIIKKKKKKRGPRLGQARGHAVRILAKLEDL